MGILKQSAIAVLIAASVVSCSDEKVTPNDLGVMSGATGLEVATKNQVIVRFNKSFLADKLDGVTGYFERETALRAALDVYLKALGLEVQVTAVYHTAIVGFSGVLTEAQRKVLELLPEVISIEQDAVVQIVGSIDKGEVSEKSMAQTTPYGITRVGRADGAGKRAFVIDTGVDLDHPDLNVNTNLSAGFTGGGIIGELLGSGDGNDDHGHGTHVAGTIAAKDNGIGVVGVAHDAEVVAIKVLAANGSGTITGVIAGIDYVATYGMPGDVANMSLSGSSFDALDAAVIGASSKGIMFALAAGNDHHDANNNSPARANGLNIYTVSAMNSSDYWASYSNYGNPPVDFCAPGSGVYSTYKNAGYRTMSGTSMAAPHIAGVLLVRGGAPATDGFVINDPDGTPDPIGVVY